MASSIPNLNTLRRGRTGPRLRGRRGPPAPPYDLIDADHQPPSISQDSIVQGTDNDASSSRLSAVDLGYLQDEYARAFASTSEPSPRRFPIINRGTHVRTTAIDALVSRFLAMSPGQRKQIISLGAGSDTRFFRLLDGTSQVGYHELDFAPNIASKRAAIERSPLLSNRLDSLQASGSRHYLHALDLRTLVQGADKILNDLETSTPTLLLSECCLCYLMPEDASAVLEYFLKNLTNSVGVAVYEPIRPFDAFGRTMITNLASRGIQLQTIKRYASLEAQRTRFRLAGFVDGQGARDVYQIWQSNDWISKTERERVEKLEWLDEIEEWRLLASHYCVAWAWRGDDLSTAWSNIDGAVSTQESSDEQKLRPD